MVISRSLGRKRKARTKKKRMRGGGTSFSRQSETSAAKARAGVRVAIGRGVSAVASVPRAVVAAVGRTMNYKHKPSEEITPINMEEYLAEQAKNDPELADSIREWQAQLDEKKAQKEKQDLMFQLLKAEEAEKNKLRIDANGKAAGISDDEREQWTERNNALPDIERYESNYIGNYFSQENKIMREKRMQKDKEQFRTKAAEKPDTEKTNAHLESESKKAKELIVEGKTLGKTIQAYDKIKEAATILKDIAETKEVIEDETIDPDDPQDQLFRKREYAWKLAYKAYNEVNEVVPEYRSDMRSKIDNIINIIINWMEINGDKLSDRHETSTPSTRHMLGGKSMKRRKYKRRKYKRRKSIKRRR